MALAFGFSLAANLDFVPESGQSFFMNTWNIFCPSINFSSAPSAFDTKTLAMRRRRRILTSKEPEAKQ